MGYTFTCDHCGNGYGHEPPFIGEFVENFLKTSDSPITEHFRPGQTVALCRDCSERLFL